ncbi:sulfurtransferase TusA family protein, partial [Bacillus altitudinis]|uniref:sulfurtransferase TusA family protein n=1 Tax=Bacillus altitudinis TaxID=293387 RepID=UPI003B51FDB9
MEQATAIVDGKGLGWGMAIVKRKKEMNEVSAGDVVEVEGRDKGCTGDLGGWSKRAGDEFLGRKVEGGV